MAVARTIDAVHQTPQHPAMTNRSLNAGHAVYAGSFDPPTLGHEDLIRRAANVFERLTVAVGVNPEKTPLFAPSERVQLMESLNLPSNVDVTFFEGLTVEFVHGLGAGVLVRGVRTVSDIEAESTLTLANRTLAPDIETIFLMASERFAHVSSSLIKQVAGMGGDKVSEHLQAFVPKAVVQPVIERMRERAAGAMA